MKKKGVITLALLLAYTVVLFSGSMTGSVVYAESLGLTACSGTFSTAKASNCEQIRKVSELTKKETTAAFSEKLDKILFESTYRSSDIGGRDWVKDNHGEAITSVYDPGLGTTVSWGWNSWGCFSYACFVSQYVRGNIGLIVSIGKESIPSVSEIKAFIEKRADPGEHIRYYYKSPLGKESVHSVAYLASDADGFYFLSESGDGLKVSVLYTTYSYFHSILRIKSGDSTLKIYDTNGSSVTSGSSASVSTKAETLVSTAKPTLRYKPDTSEYKVSYTRSLLQRDWMTTMSGGDVQYMQACLYYLGYDIEIDGFYGVASASVVKQCQKHYGLTVDGDIGPSTWPAIEKAVANNPNPNALTITAHPQSVTAYSDAQVKFSVTAKGSGLKYQWQYKKAGQSE